MILKANNIPANKVFNYLIERIWAFKKYGPTIFYSIQLFYICLKY
jgi:hypothetical protein